MRRIGCGLASWFGSFFLETVTGFLTNQQKSYTHLSFFVGEQLATLVIPTSRSTSDDIHTSSISHTPWPRGRHQQHDHHHQKQQVATPIATAVIFINAPVEFGCGQPHVHNSHIFSTGSLVRTGLCASNGIATPCMHNVKNVIKVVGVGRVSENSFLMRKAVAIKRKRQDINSVVQLQHQHVCDVEVTETVLVSRSTTGIPY